MTINLSLGEIEEIREHEEKIGSNECSKILHLAVMSLKSFSNVFYKETCYIDCSDLNKIKSALANYRNMEEKSKLFKQELMDDLDDFTKQLESKTKQQILNTEKQAVLCKAQIKELRLATEEANRKNLLSKFVKSSAQKENDAKIAILNLRLDQYEKQAQELKTNGATANEKEILIYQMHLKEKYSV